MSDKAPAFQVYAKEFFTDEPVMLMTAEMVGAYWLLLLSAWVNGSIPADLREIAALCRVSPRRMPRVWEIVGRCWQDRGDGRLVNPKMEEIRQEQESYREQQRQKAESRWQKQTEKSADAAAMPVQCSASATATSTAKEEPPCSPPVAERYDAVPDGWEAFWAEYPRKDGKRAAFKAFCKLRAGPELLAAMFAALNEHKRSPRWREKNGQFIPHASSWLNGRRWEDEGVTGIDPMPERFHGNTADDRLQRNIDNARRALEIIERGNPAHGACVG